MYHAKAHCMGTEILVDIIGLLGYNFIPPFLQANY